MKERTQSGGQFAVELVIRIMFAIADADGDGALSLEELQELHARTSGRTSTTSSPTP